MDRREAIKRTFLLTGYALTASTLNSILSGCQPDRSVTWTPVYFSKEQAEFVTHLAETILPKSGTPGAIETGVPAFIEIMVKDTFTEEFQLKFAEGIREIDEQAMKAHEKVFAACRHKQQHALIESLDAAANQEALAYREANLDKPDAEPYYNFYLQFKSLTLAGYFTSEYVGTKVLSYDPIPGSYAGCVPLKEIGNAWSL